MFKQMGFAASLGFTAVMTWQILERMSMDALAMALGIVLGIGAGLPIALLMLAAERRRGPAYGDDHTGGGMPLPLRQGAHAHRPPVVVIAPGTQPGYGQQWPFAVSRTDDSPFHQAARPRRFVVVGQGDGEIEEW